MQVYAHVSYTANAAIGGASLACCIARCCTDSTHTAVKLTAECQPAGIVLCAEPPDVSHERIS